MARFALRRAPAEYDDTFMDTMASAYLERTPWTELRLAAVRDLVEPRAGDRIVDLGCAAGAVTHFLSTFGCSVVGVDAEERAIAKARELFPELEFAVADVAALPFEAESFDKAVAADLVEHLDDAGRIAPVPARDAGAQARVVPLPIGRRWQSTPPPPAPTRPRGPSRLRMP